MMIIIGVYNTDTCSFTSNLLAAVNSIVHDLNLFWATRTAPQASANAHTACKTLRSQSVFNVKARYPICNPSMCSIISHF